LDIRLKNLIQTHATVKFISRLI